MGYQRRVHGKPFSLRKPTNQHTKMKTILAALLFVACASALPHGTYYKSWRPTRYYRPVYYYNPHHMKMAHHPVMKTISPMPHAPMPEMMPKNPKQPLETLLMLPLAPDLSKLWSQSSAIWVWSKL